MLRNVNCSSIRLRSSGDVDHNKWVRKRGKQLSQSKQTNINLVDVYLGTSEVQVFSLSDS